LIYMQPHMHLRGKDYEVRLIYPDGKMQTVFKTKWDFNWQIGVDLVKPIPIPKGTRVIGIAHFDNSANNKWNPDPTQLVFWGLQNWEEMQNCFMGYLIDPNFKDVRAIFKRSGPSLLPRGTSGPSLSTFLVKRQMAKKTKTPPVDRRNFLKTAAASAALAVTKPGAAAAQEQAAAARNASAPVLARPAAAPAVVAVDEAK